MLCSALRTFSARCAFNAFTWVSDLLSMVCLLYIHIRRSTCKVTLLFTNISVKRNMSGGLLQQLGIEVRKMTPADWDAVRSIYLEGIATSQATFETVAPSWKKWDSDHLPFARLVAIGGGQDIKGWAALSRVSARVVYAGVAEVSVYVETNSRGQGVGKILLDRLVCESEKNGIWTLQASVFPE